MKKKHRAHDIIFPTSSYIFSANSGLRSDLLGSIRGCNWHKYVNAHIKYIMANMRDTVLLQTLSKHKMDWLVK